MLALSSGIFRTIHFVDPVPKIMQRLQMELEKKGYNGESYQLHQQRGEDLIAVNGTLLIAGIGGKLMSDIILTLLQNEQLHARRLLLSPNSDEKKFVLMTEQSLFNRHYEFAGDEPLDAGGIIKRLFIYNRIDNSAIGP